MKLLVLVLAVALVGAHAAVTPKRDAQATAAELRNAIDSALDNVRDIILNGDPEAGIPVLDPFQLSHADVAIDQSVVDVAGEVDDILVTGLGAFVVDKSSIKITIIPARATVTVGLTLPDLKASGQYDLTGSVADVGSAFIKGPFTAEVVGAQAEVKVVVNIGLKLTVRSVDVNLGLGAVNADLHGIQGDEELSQQISNAINTQAVEVFDTYKPDIESTLADIIKTVVQGVL